MSENYTPKYLGVRSTAPIEKVDLIPWDGSPVTITLTCSEFTSLCPVTTQPDFGEITIVYIPGKHIIETKSLKLYLMQFRDKGAFNEALVDAIADDLWAQAQPVELEVHGEFNSRGGISIHVLAARP